MPPNLYILPDPPPPPCKTGRRDLRLQAGKAGERYRIMAVQLEAAEREPLYRSGLIEGRTAKLIHNDHQGRVVIELDGAHVILGRKESYGIQVRHAPRPPAPGR